MNPPSDNPGLLLPLERGCSAGLKVFARRVSFLVLVPVCALAAFGFFLAILGILQGRFHGGAIPALGLGSLLVLVLGVCGVVFVVAPWLDSWNAPASRQSRSLARRAVVPGKEPEAGLGWGQLVFNASVAAVLIYSHPDFGPLGAFFISLAVVASSLDTFRGTNSLRRYVIHMVTALRLIRELRTRRHRADTLGKQRRRIKLEE